MELVRVNKKELLTIVRKNRDSHRAEFEKALEGFRFRAIEELERRVADVKKGRNFSQHIGLPEPEDHTRDYDRILKMLDLSLDEEIMLGEDDLQSYVMDDWDWKLKFSTTNAFYAADSMKAKAAKQRAARASK